MTLAAEQDIPVGFLTDKHIEKLLKSNKLIVPRTWEEASIRHASYTLRIGDRVEVAHASKANTDERRDFVVRDLRPREHVDLSPGDTAKLYSIEILDLPDDILAFTVARGLLYVEALVPENTYADPGFEGSLFTTVTNLSNRVVRLKYGDPIARAFFFRLADPVHESFRKGPSKGIIQRLESYRATDLGTQDECKIATRQQLIGVISQIPMGGIQLAELNNRQERRSLMLLGFAAIWPTLCPASAGNGESVRPLR